MVLIDHYWCIHDHFTDRVVPYLSLFAKKKKTRVWKRIVLVRSISVVRFPLSASRDFLFWIF